MLRTDGKYCTITYGAHTAPDTNLANISYLRITDQLKPFYMHLLPSTCSVGTKVLGVWQGLWLKCSLCTIFEHTLLHAGINAIFTS